MRRLYGFFVCVGMCLSVWGLVAGMQAPARLHAVGPDLAKATHVLSDVLSDWATDQGDRSCMEDHCVRGSIKEFGDRFGFFAVCDGHGGSGAVDFVVMHIMPYLSQSLAKRKSVLTPVSITSALHETFMRLDGDMRFHSVKGGTTAVAALVDCEQSNLYVANVGDSRAVLCVRDAEKKILVARQLSRDHKPDDQYECRRLRSAGTSIATSFMGSSGRMYYAGALDRFGIPYPARLSCGLAMSRVLGDFTSKSVCTGLIALPEITGQALTKSDYALILATDGVWEMLSNGDAVRCLRSDKYGGFDGEGAASILNATCLKWRRVCGKNLRRDADNMAALVAYFAYTKNNVGSIEGC